MNHPDTIKYPATFDKKRPAGFDGIFDWRWTEGCFGETKITPMDFDGVVERKGHYIVFETKDNGVEVPLGQQITLRNLQNPKTFCVMTIWGKDIPRRAEITFNGKTEYIEGLENIRTKVKSWFKWANKH